MAYLRHRYSLPSERTRVSSTSALKKELSNAQPGDVIELAPGTYDVGQLTISKSGSSTKPIFLWSPSILKARILGNIKITGSWVYVIGLLFAGGHIRLEHGGRGGQCRVTLCRFDGGSHQEGSVQIYASRENRIDRCDVQNFRYRGIVVSAPGQSDSAAARYTGARDNLVDHCLIANSPAFSGNGREPMNLGRGGNHGLIPLRTKVESCFFSELYSDGEVVSVKSSYNVFHNCVFRNRKGRSGGVSPTIRFGRYNTFSKCTLDGMFALRLFGDNNKVLGCKTLKGSSNAAADIRVNTGNVSMSVGTWRGSAGGTYPTSRHSRVVDCNPAGQVRVGYIRGWGSTRGPRIALPCQNIAVQNSGPVDKGKVEGLKVVGQEKSSGAGAQLDEAAVGTKATNTPLSDQTPEDDNVEESPSTSPYAEEEEGEEGEGEVPDGDDAKYDDAKYDDDQESFLSVKFGQEKVDLEAEIEKFAAMLFETLTNEFPVEEESEELSIAEPENGEPENGEPENGEPENGEPENGEPENGEPENGEPENGEPENGEPENGEPENGESESSSPTIKETREQDTHASASALLNYYGTPSDILFDSQDEPFGDSLSSGQWLKSISLSRPLTIADNDKLLCIDGFYDVGMERNRVLSCSVWVSLIRTLPLTTGTSGLAYAIPIGVVPSPGGQQKGRGEDESTEDSSDSGVPGVIMLRRAGVTTEEAVIQLAVESGGESWTLDNFRGIVRLRKTV